MVERKNPGSYASYVVGFILSLIFTLVAYAVVQQHVDSHHGPLPHSVIIFLIVGLALAQLITQLVFFLHLNKESRPRWNLMVLSFAVLVVIIIVGGSLWIMKNLDYHHPPPSSIDQYIIHDEGIHR